MLQKRSSKSKDKDHTRYLTKRFNLWKEGKIDELLSEGDEIQRRIQSTKRKEEDSKKGFTRLMMFRKVRQALKLIDANSEVNGAHLLTDDIRQTLKHPTGAPENPEILIDGAKTVIKV